MDIAGKFPVTSTQRNRYILVIYIYQDNEILVEPLTIRESSTMYKSWKLLNHKLRYVNSQS